MTVDFAFKKVPAYRVVSTSWTGPWSDQKVRSHFAELVRFCRASDVRTGKWIFSEHGEGSFEACIEIQGDTKGHGKIRTKTLPATRVASVNFDPAIVAPRVVYHGLSDWTKWRRKAKEIRRVRSTREVYSGDPWTDPSAWKDTEVQFLVSP